MTKNHSCHICLVEEMRTENAAHEELDEAVQSYKDGNKEAFVYIYEYSSSYLRNYALYLTRNLDDAEDLFQDTYLRILEKGCSIIDNSAFMSWSRSVMYNLFINECRKNEKEFACEDNVLGAFLDAGNQTDDPSELAERKELRSAVVKAVDYLTDLQRETISQFYYCGHSIEWMAETSRTKENTIKSRLFSARQAMKTYLIGQAVV